MRYEINKDYVVIFLEGRIDSGNSAVIQDKISSIVKSAEGAEIILDADDLKYISSAGLRVLLKTTKNTGKTLEIRNVSPEVYEILDMTGFTSILNVVKKMREVSIDGCEVVGRGAIGTVYRIDEDTIVKVYDIPDAIPMIENEQKRAKQAFLKGITTAISYDIVKVGDKFGSVFEMLKASTYNDELIGNPDKLKEIVEEYTEFVKLVHDVEADEGELPDARNVFKDYLKKLKDFIPEDILQQLRNLFDSMPDDLHVVHGDIHMKNVMLSVEEPLLIDMDTLSTGDPVFDLAGLYVTYVLFNADDPANSMRFLGLTNEQCEKIWSGILKNYFATCSEDGIRRAEERIKIVAAVRFLFILLIIGVGEAALMEARIERAKGILKELVPKNASLDVRRFSS